MDSLVYDKLQWQDLLSLLEHKAQTLEGKERCTSLQPNLNREVVEDNWRLQQPLRDLIRSGYTPPIGDLPNLRPVFRGAKLGQILDGESLWNVHGLLQTVRHFHQFAQDFHEKCPTLLRYQKLTYSLPKLNEAIAKAVSPEGEILDTASPELARLRKQKLSIRKKIEQDIKSLLTDNELEMYLQDKFFTVRSERYVVPIRLDGRGRVKGSILDTSDSGQTLYIEPESIKPLNENLQEIELSEKLEVLRIFRDLSAQVSAEVEALEANYEYMIELDVLTAQAGLAASLDAGPVKLSDEPCLDLAEARHPLVKNPSGAAVVANTISLDPQQKLLIVSGPNAGGKTVVLKTVGILHLMAKAGLMIPAHSGSRLYLFDRLFVEMGDSQNLSASLSTFSGHVLGLKPILEQSQASDLVLLDELAVGTEPVTGAAIGQAILEELASRQVTGIVTTHFDNLKGLAVSDERFRNGSMEFSTSNLKPTYRLILDIPGQSYGLEVAEQIGLSHHVIERARKLKGETGSSLDQLVDELQSRIEKAREQEAEYQRLKLDMEAQKHRWEQERDALKQAKSKASEKVKKSYAGQIDQMRSEFNEALDKMKSSIKVLELHDPAVQQSRKTAHDQRRDAEKKLSDLDRALSELSSNFEGNQTMPGQPAKVEDLQAGSRVYIVSLAHEATVTRVGEGEHPTVEVTAGLLKLKPSIQDLRILNDTSDKSERSRFKKRARNQTPEEDKKIGFVVPTSQNSLDLRGLDAERAMDRTWQFIDKAVLRGELNLVLIHGHGTDILKRTVRTELAKNSPYNLDFRPGEKEEGGDGVTVVQLRV